jgi:predicted CXXCH cytochrome family protein
MGVAHGAYVDCRMCHLDPAPGSLAKDYFDYFVLRERQHRTGMAYPPAQNQEFFRPTKLGDDVAFFDRNDNGVADLEEVQLFGTEAKVECASCHREHGQTPPPAQPNMYLRMPDDMLCMVCHRT